MITVLGSVNMDLIATVDRLPAAGETVTGSHFTTAAGGKGANQALAARRAGAAVRLCGAVGKDGFADPSLALLAQSGADLEAVRRVDGATGTALILVDAQGENVIAVVPGANGHVGADDARSATAPMQKGDHLLLQLEIPAPAVAAGLHGARAAGAVSVLNTAPLTADARELAALADIVVANETEFELLSGQRLGSAAQRDAELMRRHRARRQTLVVTLGAEGVIAAWNGDLIHIDGLVIDPVDTVGAGDTFCGYLAAAIDAGLPFETALRRAAAAGSLACLKPGAQPAIPLAAEVDAALA